MFDRRDLVGQAQTGTGKTASFGIPIAELIDSGKQHVQAIVLVPTRELAHQVADELKRLTKYRGLEVVTLYGGEPIHRQFARLHDAVQVIVGTPGRIIDHLDRGTLRIDKVDLAILDEADRMLDIGFAPDIRRILRSTPRSRQTALFSATIPTQIRRLIYSYLHEPDWVIVGGESEAVPEVKQLYYEVAERNKASALMEIMEDFGDEQILIFRRTRIGVDKLHLHLSRHGFQARAIHGGMPQTKRDSAMRSFRDGRLKILIATDVASRGLDIPAVSKVISYDIPDNIEDYIHRIGRTARMGRPGTAILFVAEWDLGMFDEIREHVGENNISSRELQLYS
ncbi:DEAD/DEAH box helicase [Dehalococcoidia bacterium]|nr:DEAD/DEAH box helicase [Dehalococcoidia bacterium]